MAGVKKYGYGSAQGLPDTKVGAFTQALYDQSKKQGWTVISMENEWRHISTFSRRDKEGSEP